MTLPFLKMHGLGNDFVVIDTRSADPCLSRDQIAAIANRRTGVGCDQFILIEPPRSADAAAFMRIHNPDGSESGACGNATRCVASLLMRETGRDTVVIQTMAGLLRAEAAPGGLVAVDMGPARLDWREIPLAQAHDTLHLPLEMGTLGDPVAVSMGNPHCVFFVPDVGEIPLDYMGPALEHHSLFPERTNVEIVQVLSPTRLRMRVWERSAGITQACGTGACATLVAAARRGLSQRRAEVILDGGTLVIEWLENGHVLMTGPAATSFSGTLTSELAGELA